MSFHNIIPPILFLNYFLFIIRREASFWISSHDDRWNGRRWIRREVRRKCWQQEERHWQKEEARYLRFDDVQTHEVDAGKKSSRKRWRR